MRDPTLLKDILFYLAENEPTDGLLGARDLSMGRLNKNLRKRVEKELELDPDELRKLCSTTVQVFEDPKTDCTPSRPWQLLIDKMRIAIKKKELIVPTSSDPFVYPLLSRDTQKKDTITRTIYPFRPEDRKND